MLRAFVAEIIFQPFEVLLRTAVRYPESAGVLLPSASLKTRPPQMLYF